MLREILMPYRAWSFRSWTSVGLSTFSHLLSWFSQGTWTLLASKQIIVTFRVTISHHFKNILFWAYLEHSWWINRMTSKLKDKTCTDDKTKLWDGLYSQIVATLRTTATTAVVVSVWSSSNLAWIVALWSKVQKNNHWYATALWSAATKSTAVFVKHHI